MLMDKGLCDGQPQTAATLAAGHQREEDFVANCIRHAGAIVDDLHHQAEAVQATRQSDLTRDAGSQDDLTVAPERLSGVASDVEQRLDDLLLVYGYGGRAHIVVATDTQTFRILR